MAVTVFDAMKLPVMERTKLVAGQAGLSNPIHWVTIVEVIEDETRLQQNEFLITTAYGLQNSTSAKREFIEKLSSRQLSAVAIQTGFYLQSIPQEFIEAANRYQLPLIELPSELNFSMITRELLQQVVNNRLHIAEFSESIYHKLTNLLITKQNLQSIADSLEQWINGHIIICDDEFVLLAGRSTLYSLEKLLHVVLDYSDSGSISIRNPTSNEKHSVSSFKMTYSEVCFNVRTSPIIAANSLLGYVIVLKEDDFSDLDLLAMEHASTICALEFLAKKQIKESQRRFKADLLTEVFRLEHSESREVQNRLMDLGMDLQQRHTVVQFYAQNCSWDATMTRTVEKFFDSLSLWYLSKETINGFIVLCRSDELLSITRQLEKRLTEWKNPKISAAIGASCAELVTLRESATDAELIRKYAPVLNPDSLVSDITSLEPYLPFINMLEQGLSLSKCYHKLLYPLLTAPYLLDTLETLLRNNMSRKLTSQELFIHRHTLNYRIEKIEGLTNRSLHQPRDRFEFQIALIAYRLSHEVQIKSGTIESG
ncbi:PucR family transcriptional regulator [Alicyclobacillus sp. SO9]|uniref:PucR family transcriptional regulator n=1 Tax=Alicyclobacillus sp. SO9 TaxID=2665646 RepID=UPI0018E70F53|nr:PucR family transcriptional regulator [Alicyclobacillus sp. SO9]QQE79770.1 PucR family transcriptional regulator ligand-binding domain-containing protein [Alicyclobacillus sp. SO9]